MDIPDPQSDLFLKIDILETFDDVAPAAGRFDRDHIKIHLIDLINDFTKFRITDMRMDLGFRICITRQPERLDRPIKIIAPSAAFDRRLLPDGRFVDLVGIRRVAGMV